MLNNNIKRDGSYYSPKADNELEKLQKKKTIFMLLSTLFFAISIFIPADISNLSTLGILFYINVYIAVIVLSVVVSVYGKNSHKIKKVVPLNNAPKFGYKRFTYVSYELFTVSHLVSAVAQISMSIFVQSYMVILSAVFMMLSLIFCLTGRFVLIYANNDMQFIETNNNIDNSKDE